MGKHGAVCLGLWFWLPSSAQADTLLMANGDRYSGRVTEQGDHLLITLDYGGTLRLPSSAVSQWQHGSRAAAIAQRATVSTITATTATTVAVSSALADAADPEAADKWKLGGNGDLDLRLKRNSTQTNNIFFKGALELEKEEVWRHSLAAEYTYETSDDVTKTHKYKIEPAIDYFLGPQAFW